ncbi:levodione reductase-like [Sycon ciliatum]|uniref:levodione reductase-like n=1 Tax=Sycon ciliatum TaxID=27933 RepID=UPI0031F5F52E
MATNAGNENGGQHLAASGIGQQRFAGKTIVITGAAGDIGSAAARRFFDEGCNVVLVDLDAAKPRLERLSTELAETNKASRVTSSSSSSSEKSRDTLVAVADVRRRAEVDAVFERAWQQFGGVDFVFNNAGIQGYIGPSDTYDEDTFRQVMDVNVVGVFIVMQAAAAAIIKHRKESGGQKSQSQSQAVIVNTSSLAGLLGPPNMLAYTASKHAVIGMTRTAAKDLARHGIRVCAIAPGLLEGAMWSTQTRGQAACGKAADSGVPLSQVTLDDDEITAVGSHMLAGTAMKRLGTQDEVAGVLAFLCSSDASYLTGNVITIDGGRFC